MNLAAAIAVSCAYLRRTSPTTRRRADSELVYDIRDHTFGNFTPGWIRDCLASGAINRNTAVAITVVAGATSNDIRAALRARR
jgi:hypothetical protein